MGHLTILRRFLGRAFLLRACAERHASAFRLIALLLCIAALWPFATLAQDSRPAENPGKAVPSATLTRAAIERLKSTYKGEYSREGVEARRALSQKFMELAKDDSGVLREEDVFALLEEARELAIDGGDVQLSFDAIDKSAARFGGDGLVTKVQAVTRAASKTRDATRAANLEHAMELAENLLAIGDWAAASAVAEAGRSITKRVATIEASLLSKWRIVEQAVDVRCRVGRAEAVLRTEPLNPEANRTLGMHYCFEDVDLERGLAHLAASQVDELAGIAKRDLARPTTLSEQEALAESWRVWARPQKRQVRRVALDRARHWYGLALAQAESQDWIRVNKSLGTLSDDIHELAMLVFFNSRPDLRKLRQHVGRELYCVVTGSQHGRIWGSGEYTDDSDISIAAVHAGILRNGERGVVKVTVRAGADSYKGATRNGITSLDYVSFGGSYSVEAAMASVAGTTRALAADPGLLTSLRSKVGESFLFLVAADTGGTVYGTGLYTDDSKLSAAVVHAGLMKEGQQGVVKVTILPGAASYAGSEQNGVTSKSWNEYHRSFRIDAVRLLAKP